MTVKGGEWKERVNASSTNVISRVEREIQFVCVRGSKMIRGWSVDAAMIT